MSHKFLKYYTGNLRDISGALCNRQKAVFWIQAQKPLSLVYLVMAFAWVHVIGELSLK